MDKKLSWIQFDGPSFQKLCNAIIYYHVSKLACVYSAPGKDGGIDQYYIGSFGENTGKWRFQDKFHMGKSAHSNFKSDIKRDIKDHFKGEDFIVFMTNINLSPPQMEELLEAAYEALSKFPNHKTKVEIWHEANIETILVELPFIYTYYWDVRNHVLESYQNFFEARLNLENAKGREQLTNPFIVRQPLFDYLNQFILHKQETSLILYSNRGQGKTRACIEFFKTYVESKEEFIDYYPIVLINRFPENFALIKEQLNSEKKFIVLVDDFQVTANQHAVLELLRYVENERPRIKLIFTVESQQLEGLKISLDVYNYEVLYNEVFSLSITEIRTLVKAMLPKSSMSIRNSIAHLSQGNAFAVLDCCRAISSGLQLDQMDKYEKFSDLIVAQLNRNALIIAQATGVPKHQIDDIFNLLTLVNPVKRNDEVTALLSKATDVPTHVFEQILDMLVTAAFLSDKSPDTYKIAVPAYSVTILKQLKNSQLLQFVSNPNLYSFYINILVNLKSAINSVDIERLLACLDEMSFANFIQNIDSKTASKMLSDLAEINIDKAQKVLAILPDEFIASTLKESEINDLHRITFEFYKIAPKRVAYLFESILEKDYFERMLTDQDDFKKMALFLTLIRSIGSDTLKGFMAEAVKDFDSSNLIAKINESKLRDISECLVAIKSFSVIKAFKIFQQISDEFILNSLYELTLGGISKPITDFYKVDQTKVRRLLSQYDNHAFIKQSIKIRVNFDLICQTLNEIHEVNIDKVQDLYKNLSSQRIFIAKSKEAVMTNFISCYVRLHRLLPTLTEELFLKQLEGYTIESKVDSYRLQTLAFILTKLSSLNLRHHNIALNIFKGQFHRIKTQIKDMTFRQIIAAVVQLSLIDKSLSDLILSKITDDEWVKLAKATKGNEGIMDGLNELKNADLMLFERLKFKLGLIF